MLRVLDRTDTIVAALDAGLRSLLVRQSAARPSPAVGIEEPQLSARERRTSAALMRVNHAGELAAQALYHGQAIVTDETGTRRHLLAAADEERDHLAWCAERIEELDGRPSLLAPLWFGGSVAIGALAAGRGDAASLGFVTETERQVEAHLADHVDRLPSADSRSRVILEQMARDEQRHGAEAAAAGGSPVPRLQRALMHLGGEFLRRTAAIL